MALERIEGPLVGPRRDDLRAASVAAMIANVNRGKKDKPFDLDDVALKFQKPPELTPEQERKRLGLP